METNFSVKIGQEKAHSVVPDIAQSRLKCVDAGCIHRPLVQQIPPI